MEFTFHTVYNQKAMTALARTLRKTVRKKRSRRSHIFGWAAVVLGLLISSPFGNGGFVPSFRNVATWLAVLAILAVLLWEDSINGYIAFKRILPGTQEATATFTPQGYHSSTPFGESDFQYGNIAFIAETEDYFVFGFSKSHAQLYDKGSILGGTAQAFCQFIEAQTGKAVEKV